MFENGLQDGTVNRPDCSGRYDRKEVPVLRVLRGKKLIIVEQRPMLTEACRERMTAAGPRSAFLFDLQETFLMR